MNVISQMVTQQLSGAASKQIAARLGVSESTANMAVGVAVPLILSALARNAAQPQGAQDLHQAITRDHDGGILNNLMGYLGNPEQGNAGKEADVGIKGVPRRRVELLTHSGRDNEQTVLRLSC